MNLPEPPEDTNALTLKDMKRPSAVNPDSNLDRNPGRSLVQSPVLNRHFSKAFNKQGGNVNVV